ncbi:MAG TPA: branched-chain amino acid transporter [Lachnoclostridium phytofermentans]|uniref:Branched-chain amino acid transporter n=1 Tax=Lachnoclostridium phytofermentans TaxID=66219 RepID=A0A3D2X572_9FIRM|nr:branched-chain amino acid transporter [Lachnoclostridium phytofermentans]
MTIERALLAVIIMALVTYIPRALPITLFRREIKSVRIKSFLNYVPYAVLGALTFPDVFESTGNVITALCGAIVAFLLAYFNRSLVIVAVGAILTVFVTGLLF